MLFMERYNWLNYLLTKISVLFLCFIKFGISSLVNTGMPLLPIITTPYSKYPDYRYLLRWIYCRRLVKATCVISREFYRVDGPHESPDQSMLIHFHVVSTIGATLKSSCTVEPAPSMSLGLVYTEHSITA